MYAYLQGTLVEATPSSVTLDVQGIGYRMYIPAHLFSQLPPLQSSLQLYTAFVIREFSQTLYGFLHAQERDLFALLIEAKGVGPKMALSLLGHLPLDAFLRAVQLHDIGALSKVPGVGKKTAERLLLELRDKLVSWGSMPPLSHAGPPKNALLAQDAVDALVNLGYPASVAQQAVQSSLEELPEKPDISLLLTTALRKT